MYIQLRERSHLGQAGIAVFIVALTLRAISVALRTTFGFAQDSLAAF
jgi:hypothetical protein